MIASNTLKYKRNFEDILSRTKRYISITKMSDMSITVLYHGMSLIVPTEKHKCSGMVNSFSSIRGTTRQNILRYFILYCLFLLLLYSCLKIIATKKTKYDYFLTCQIFARLLSFYCSEIIF